MRKIMIVALLVSLTGCCVPWGWYGPHGGGHGGGHYDRGGWGHHR